MKSRDGLKKQSFTVKVITPISGIQLSSAGPNKTNVLSYGKSLKLKATTFSTYGKPADTKLKWEAFVYQHGGADVTAQVGSDLSIKNGVLTLKKAAVAWNLSYITVKVTPAAYYNTDYASDLVDTFTVYVINPVKSMTLENPYKNQPKTVDLTNADMLSSNPTCAGYEWLYLNEGGLTAYNNGDNIQQLLTVKSSNPKLVSARLEKMTPGVFRVAVASPDPLNMPEKKTTVKITVTANDGSGKSVSFNVTVQNVGTGMG